MPREIQNELLLFNISFGGVTETSPIAKKKDKTLNYIKALICLDAKQKRRDSISLLKISILTADVVIAQKKLPSFYIQ